MGVFEDLSFPKKFILFYSAQLLLQLFCFQLDLCYFLDEIHLGVGITQKTQLLIALVILKFQICNDFLVVHKLLLIITFSIPANNSFVIDSLGLILFLNLFLNNFRKVMVHFLQLLS